VLRRVNHGKATLKSDSVERKTIGIRPCFDSPGTAKSNGISCWNGNPPQEREAGGFPGHEQLERKISLVQACAMHRLASDAAPK
jgi:hypothetical protein